MGQRRRVCGGSPEELGAQPVGHPRGLGAGRDGAAAHGPQARVLAEMQTWRQSGRNQERGPRPAAGETATANDPSADQGAGRRLPSRSPALLVNHTLRRAQAPGTPINKTHDRPWEPDAERCARTQQLSLPRTPGLWFGALMQNPNPRIPPVGCFGTPPPHRTDPREADNTLLKHDGLEGASYGDSKTDTVPCTLSWAAMPASGARCSKNGSESPTRSPALP